MKNSHVIDIFATLGERLSSFGCDPLTRQVIERACADNLWFSPYSLHSAVDAISRQVLDYECIKQWLERYDQSAHQPANVGVIVAGNIPLVGFFDVMCTLAAGDNCYLKCSSKDSVMMNYVVGVLREIDNQIAVFDYDESIVLDAVIATGSDNTNRYFRARYPNIRSLFRGHRSSLAVLSGAESDAQLEGLAHDIFIYNGLGCRNISLLAVPKGYNINRLVNIFAPCRDLIVDGYVCNYRQTKAMMSLAGEEFVDGGFFILSQAGDFSDSISRINFFEYPDLEYINKWIEDNDHKIQCVESDCVTHQRLVGFGCSQMPSLTDYPDGVDIMDFLHSL